MGLFASLLPLIPEWSRFRVEPADMYLEFVIGPEAGARSWTVPLEQ